jgi:hypothetical protein
MANVLDGGILLARIPKGGLGEAPAVPEAGAEDISSTRCWLYRP